MLEIRNLRKAFGALVVIDRGREVADDTLDGLQSRVAAAVGGGRASLETVFLTLTGRSLRD